MKPEEISQECVEEARVRFYSLFCIWWLRDPSVSQSRILQEYEKIVLAERNAARLAENGNYEGEVKKEDEVKEEEDEEDGADEDDGEDSD